MSRRSGKQYALSIMGTNGGEAEGTWTVMWSKAHHTGVCTITW